MLLVVMAENLLGFSIICPMGRLTLKVGVVAIATAAHPSPYRLNHSAGLVVFGPSDMN